MENSLIADAELSVKGYTISTDKQLLDLKVIYSFLNNESYWSKGIPFERLQKAIGNSLCFGVYHHQQQCGFARVITDNATFAYICDVFVISEHRGQGLSKWLIKTITNHKELQGLRRWSLATADAHGLYRQYGFTPVSKPELWMEIYNPYSLNQ
ncbi:GNAT family N-acetyltransferase [uncultured Mucilaginibacter sp.]|uniref:GNAT family N-acetyltransferase n=1 Tax=uncultured Mucilaginibacter sp. TaxID=797541 RepID=UPI0025FA34D9|nr:GNAT family N-acetyltransferase [uncultured Mucilaginibacter sp.]